MKQKIENGILDPMGKYPNPLTNKPYSSEYLKYTDQWTTLPVYQDARKIIQQIQEHQILFVVSTTGSGKSVLIPKYALHSCQYEGKVIVTNPKSLATRKNAEYAAKLLDVTLGKEVGFQFRGSNIHSKPSKSKHHTKLLFSTDGSLVAECMADPALTGYQVVIIDEVHERTVNIDLLLLLLKQALTLNSKLRVILMSATVDVEMYRRYYQDFNFHAIEVTGLTYFPITTHYCDQPIDVSQTLVQGLQLYFQKILPYIHKTNDKTLFFVNGVKEGQDTCATFEKKCEKKCLTIASKVTDTVKELLEDRNYPLVFATNIAESSITIPNLNYVIDNGYCYQVTFDVEYQMYRLATVRISKASAIQRQGRVGRTQPGTCYRLYTEYEFKHFPNETLNDILTSDLTNTLLRIIPLSVNYVSISQFMASLITPPSQSSIDISLQKLHEAQLIEFPRNQSSNPQLTELGKTVICLRKVDSYQSALLMIEAYRLSCAKDAAYLVAALQVCDGQMSNIFLSNRHKNDVIRIKEIQKLRKPIISKRSDFLTLYRVIIAAINTTSNVGDQQLLSWCMARNLHYGNIKKCISDAKNIYRETLTVCQQTHNQWENVHDQPTDKHPDVQFFKKQAFRKRTCFHTKPVVKMSISKKTTKTNIKKTCKKSVTDRLIKAIRFGYQSQIINEHQGKYINNNTAHKSTISTISSDSYVTKKSKMIYYKLYNIHGKERYCVVSSMV